MVIILASEHLFAGSKREPEVRDRDLSAFVGTARSSESLAALRTRPLPAIFCTAYTSDELYFYTYILHVHLNTCYVRSRRALTFSPLILAHKITRVEFLSCRLRVQQRLDFLVGFFVQQEERARFEYQQRLLELLARFDGRRYAFSSALATGSLTYVGDLLHDLSVNANCYQLPDDKKVYCSHDCSVLLALYSYTYSIYSRYTLT